MWLPLLAIFGGHCPKATDRTGPGRRRISLASVQGDRHHSVPQDLPASLFLGDTPGFPGSSHSNTHTYTHVQSWAPDTCSPSTRVGSHVHTRSQPCWLPARDCPPPFRPLPPRWPQPACTGRPDPPPFPPSVLSVPKWPVRRPPVPWWGADTAGQLPVANIPTG